MAVDVVVMNGESHRNKVTDLILLYCELQIRQDLPVFKHFQSRSYNILAIGTLLALMTAYILSLHTD